MATAGPMCTFFARMPSHKYIQKLFTIIEFVIIFLIIAFLVATTIPGLLRVRKHSHFQDCDIGTIIKSARNCINQRSNLSEIGLAAAFYPCNAVTL
jgi:hypothetical protein